MKNNTHRYTKHTFVLSVIGFIGSIGFYLGVLRQVYSTPDAAKENQLLKQQNADLTQQVQVLTHSLQQCQNNE